MAMEVFGHHKINKIYINPTIIKKYKRLARIHNFRIQILVPGRSGRKISRKLPIHSLTIQCNKQRIKAVNSALILILTAIRNSSPIVNITPLVLNSRIYFNIPIHLFKYPRWMSKGHKPLLLLPRLIPLRHLRKSILPQV